MIGHVIDELPLLLTGEADRATVAAVSAHLRMCEDCRDELIEVIAGHAALTSAAKYAPDLVDPVVADAAPAGRSEVSGPRAAPIDLSSVFAQVRAEVDAEAETPADDVVRPLVARTRSRRTWLAAAAAVVVLGGGAGAYFAVSGSSSPAGQHVALSAFDKGTTSASARLIGGDELTLDASSLPRLAAEQYYEVWLTNGARTAMAPIGLLDADRKASFAVPATEMASYAAVEVSVQDTSGVGSYSGQSVLRGSYA